MTRLAVPYDEYQTKRPLKKMFPPGLEPGTFRVLGERDNHYTTETLGTRPLDLYTY